MRRVRWRAAGFISPIRMERCFWGVTGASSCHAAGFVSLSRTEMYLRPVQRRILLAGQPAHFLLSRRRVISLCRMQTRPHAVLRRIFLCCAECKCALMPCRGENILPRLSRCVSYCPPTAAPPDSFYRAARVFAAAPPTSLRRAECRLAFMPCRGGEHSPCAPSPAFFTARPPLQRRFHKRSLL